MNENQEPTQKPIEGDEVSADTTDVRAAIERAKENMQSQQEQKTEPAAAPIAPPASEQPMFEKPAFEQTAAEQSATEQVTAHQSHLTPADHVNIDTVGMQIASNEEMPTAAPIAPAPSVLPPPQPAAQEQPYQQVNIPSDHPMAPLYIQQPNPPVPKANRLAGVLISLLATVAFALLYAGLIALSLAFTYPPSTFLQEGLLPYITSLGFVFPVVAFLIIMVILVLIFNRAGWWVYAVLGVVVAVIVWGAAGAGYSLSPQIAESVNHIPDATKPFDINHMAAFTVTLPAFLAALAAREVAVWFGAWIGSRGRKVKLRNEADMKEYEQKLAEVQAQVL